MTEQTIDESTRETQAELARTRTLLAMDRTLLAWIRTSLSMIASGFTLARIVHDLIIAGTLNGVNAQYPREVGLTLVLLGIAGLLGGAFDHWRSVKRHSPTLSMSTWSSSFVVALILAGLSVLLLINLLMNLNPSPR